MYLYQQPFSCFHCYDSLLQFVSENNCHFKITRHENQAETDVKADDSLPDQLINPEEYEPVVLTTEEHRAAQPPENKQPVNDDPRKLTPVCTYGSIS